MGMRTLEGRQTADGLRFGVVVSKFNECVTGKLLQTALEVLANAGVQDDAIQVVRVPGAFEIPLVAQRLAQSGQFHAIICLGAVIRGETPHFEWICAEVSRGIAHVALHTNIPVIFGVLTTNTVEQALERAGPPDRNRGAEAARTALEMATLLAQVSDTSNVHTEQE